MDSFSDIVETDEDGEPVHHVRRMVDYQPPRSPDMTRYNRSKSRESRSPIRYMKGTQLWDSHKRKRERSRSHSSDDWETSKHRRAPRTPIQSPSSTTTSEISLNTTETGSDMPSEQGTSSTTPSPSCRIIPLEIMSTVDQPEDPRRQYLTTYWERKLMSTGSQTNRKGSNVTSVGSQTNRMTDAGTQTTEEMCGRPRTITITRSTSWEEFEW